MIARTIDTPGGDTIEVLTDDDICGLFPGTPQNALSLMASLDSTSGHRRAVIADLWANGPAIDRSGRAVQTIVDRVDDPTLTRGTASAVLNAGLVSMLLDVDRNAKRTHRIRLASVPDRWLPALRTIAPEPVDVPPADDPVPVAAPSDEAPSPVDHGAATITDDDNRPVVEGRIADAVATALLAQVVEIISTRDGAAPAMGRLQLDITALEERLGTQVSYVEKLRRDLRAVGDELAAVKMERDGLRTRLRTAEHNLKVATSGDARRIVDEEVRRAVAGVMRETPIGSHGTDLVSAVPARVNGSHR